MGPYGIEQVDIGGALSALEAARSNRIRSMLLQRQLSQQEQALEAQRGLRAAIGRFSGDGSATPAAPAATGGMADAVNLYDGQAAPAAVDATAPPAAPVPTPAGHGDISRLTTELLAIDPEHAPQIIQAFRQMNDDQFQAAQRRNQVLAREAYNLLHLPPEQRQAEFNRVAPSLIADGGVTRQQLAGFEISDANLRHVIAQARDVEKLAEEARPNYREVSGEVIDERRLERGENPVVYRSEFIATPQGLARRPNAGAAPRPATAEENATATTEGGYTYTPGPGGRANPQNWRAVQGGASPSSGSRPFP